MPAVRPRSHRDAGARGDGRPVPSRRPRPRNGRTAGGVISAGASGTGMSGTRRMPGRPSRFPAGGTTAAGRIRAAAGRSAVAGVPTRVTLFRVRMIRVRSAGGVTVSRAPGRPASGRWLGSYRAASLGAASACGAGCGRARWFASGRRVRAGRAARVQAGPELGAGRGTTRAILPIPATWPAVGAAPSLVTRGTALGRMVAGWMVVGWMVVGRRLSLGGLAVPTGRAGPGIRGAVGRIPTSRLTAARPTVAGRTLSRGVVRGADEAGGTGRFRRGRPDPDELAYGPAGVRVR